MPPKRKATTTSEGHSSKKARTPSPPGRSDSVNAIGDRNNTRKEREVEWAMPTRTDNKRTDDSDMITRFAPVFYCQQWQHLRTKKQRFPSALMRSPLYKKTGSKNKVSDPENPGRYNNALLRLFNRIKKDTESKNPIAPVRYSRQDFECAFGAATNGVAVVASASEANPIQALNGDLRVVVTIRSVSDEDQVARAAFIRCLPPGVADDNSTDYAYFINLPPQTKITVNGRTYINDGVEEDSKDTQRSSAQILPAPFIIGPLEQYTVIELLSQPMFFFRTKADLDFTRKSYPKAHHFDDGVRDTNGDTEEDVIDVTWQPFEASSSTKPSSLPAAGTPSKEFDVTDTNDECWTDGARILIEDPCDYLRQRLWTPQRDHFDELIPRILASINLHQTPPSGFSFTHGGRVFRPGRTFMTALSHRNYHVLLVVRVNEKGGTEMHVLDPMAWRSKRDERGMLVERAHEFVLSCGWKPAASVDLEDPQRTSLLAVSWASCAQSTNEEEASTYVVLNAWALSMDLQVDPSFTPTNHGSENFFTRAQWLFGLALQDQLDWKLLTAFFQCTRFVKSTDSTSEEQEYSGPPSDRRFRQSKRTFQRAIEEQTDADKAKSALSGEEPAPCLSVRMGVGKTHLDLFPADVISEEELNHLRPQVLQGRWNLTKSTVQRQVAPSKSGATGTPTARPNIPDTAASGTGAESLTEASQGPTNPTDDTTPKTPRLQRGQELPVNFFPCEYLKKEIDARKAQANTSPASQDLTLNFEEVIDCISGVASLVNKLQPDGQGTAAEGQASLTNPDKIKTKISERIVLIPWEHGRHTTLVVAQIDPENPQGNLATLDVLDSAPWTLKQDQRKQIRQAVSAALLRRWRFNDKVPRMPAVMTWTFGPRQKDLWQCSYFTVLNSWTVLLGCTLNLRFSPGMSFFEEANVVMQILRAGYADWRLIYSFLCCHNYIMTSEISSKGRWFQTREGDKTRSQIAIQTDDEDVGRPANSYDFLKQVNRKLTRPHDRMFGPWEDWDDDDVFTRVPVLCKADRFNENHHATELRNAYHELITQPRQSQESLLDGVKPCVYLKTQLADLLKDTDTAQRLGSLRSLEDVTFQEIQWLFGDEVNLAIASVTLAITDIQDATGGFSVIPQSDAELCRAVDLTVPTMVAQPATRFCRPIFTPMVVGAVHNAHTVLVLIQLDPNDALTVSVVDSKSYFFSREQRGEILERARAIVQQTSWWRNKFSSFREVPQPKEARWIPCAQQPDDLECGYYTIINGWALALGLELNPHAQPNWDDTTIGGVDLYNMLFNISHLARLGLVDWRLIYAFLRCYRFVHDGHVPHDRRFTHTVRLRDEAALRAHLDQLSLDEMTYWSQPERTDTEIANTKGKNAIELPDGFSHRRLTEDNWSTQGTPRGKALELAEIGHLHMDMDRRELEDHWRYFCLGKAARNKATGKQVGIDKANFFMNPLIRQRKTVATTSHDKLLKMYRDFLFNKRGQEGSDTRLRQKCCALASEGLGLLETLLANVDISKHLASAIPPAQKGRALDAVEVNLAIAAVVEAIDSRQANAHRGGTPFTAGYALMSTITQVVSRPRRTWFLPMTLDGLTIEDHLRGAAGKPLVSDPREKNRLRNLGHHFLAVVQEDLKPTKDKQTTCFCVYTLDSSQRFANPTAQQLFYSNVVNTADNVGWSTERNDKDRPGGQVKFMRNHKQIPVFQALRGGWQCGLHTILNAWILALGLMPRATLKRQLTNEFYEELWILVRASIAGLLDWKTLVAWLFCNDIVVSRDLDKITVDRRFETTVYQDGNELGLTERVTKTNEEGTIALLGVSEDEVPYTHRNNVEFASALNPVTAVAAAGNVIAADDEEEEDDEDEEEDYEEEDQFRPIESEGLGFPVGSMEHSILTLVTPDDRKKFLAAAVDEREQLLDDFQYQLAAELAAEDTAANSANDSFSFSFSFSFTEIEAELSDATVPSDEDEYVHVDNSDGLTDADAEGDMDDDVEVAPENSLKRTIDSLDFDFPRKRVKFEAASDLSFLNEVHKDGDRKMEGSPWRKAKGNLSFLNAF